MQLYDDSNDPEDTTVADDSFDVSGTPWTRAEWIKYVKARGGFPTVWPFDDLDEGQPAARYPLSQLSTTSGVIVGGLISGSGQYYYVLAPITVRLGAVYQTLMDEKNSTPSLLGKAVDAAGLTNPDGSPKKLPGALDLLAGILGVPKYLLVGILLVAGYAVAG